MNLHEDIDDKAVQSATRYLKEEALLLQAIQEVDLARTFEAFGYPSLFVYCTQRLKLSEATAYAFISVARKAASVPQLKQAVTEGVLNVSQAKRIVSVIDSSNASQWIEMAAASKQRELEREVAARLPAPAPSERVRPAGGGMSELTLVVPEALRRKVERLQEVRGCSMVEALAVAVEEALDRHDPVLKAERNLGKQVYAQLSSRRVPQAQVRHRVFSRDQGQCTFKYGDGRRCEGRRWLQIHHEKPVSAGGLSTVDNLSLLCAQHHRITHAKDYGKLAGL